MNMATDASSSTLSSSKNHDVFLSFRGQDVRKGFISHLYKDLSRNNVETFKDDAKLKIGDQIPQSLLKAIEESKVSVVVFSKNYADSRWCLNELLHILKCRENGHCLLPVFYDGVEPSHVRNQTGSYGAAFVELQKKFKIDELSQWKDALTRAANITGPESRNTRNDAELVDKIVEEVKSKLNDLTSPIIDTEDLVGIDDQVEEVQSLLYNGSAEVHTCIWGMGGIGKTTLAKVVFSKLSSQFESSYFLEGVSDERKNGVSFTTLRNKLLARILKEYNAEYLECISSVKEKLESKNVLVVLDDLSDSTQFDKLFSEAGFKFGNKSRIIVTTRDSRVVKPCEIYPVKELNDKDAFKVLCSYAFNKRSCPMEYTELTKRVVKDYAKGLPFALKWLGKYLNSRSKREWESKLEKLKKIPHKEVQDMLEKSFDPLDYDIKKIFLHIACFFKGEDRGFVERILYGCQLSSCIGIGDLIEKSLVTIRKDNKLWMHSLIQQMGQEIVSKKSRENGPNIPCRFWNADRIYDALLESNTGTEVVEGIFIDKSKIENKLHLNRTFFSNMPKLRFLKICNSSSLEMSKVDLPHEGLESLPQSLVYFHWHNYPGKHFPSNQNLRKLKRIDLSNSERLTQVQDLSLASNVESINLECCRSLLQLPPDFQNLHKLTSLNLNGCSSLQQLLVLPRNLEYLHMKNCTTLESIPTDIYELKSLCHLDLSGCSNLKNFPEISSPMECLRDLILDRTAIVKLPSSIRNLTALHSLSLEMCENLEELECCRSLLQLPPDFQNLHKLTSLNLNGCSSLQQLLELPRNLEYLHMKNCTRLESIPTDIYELKSLCHLDLSGCSNLKNFPEISSPMECLRDLILDRTAIVKLPSSIRNLTALNSLSLEMCENLEELPDSISMLTFLERLSLRYCPKLRSLPELLPSRPTVDTTGCTSLPPSVYGSEAVNDGFDYIHHKVGAKKIEAFVSFDERTFESTPRKRLKAEFKGMQGPI